MLRKIRFECRLYLATTCNFLRSCTGLAHKFYFSSHLLSDLRKGNLLLWSRHPFFFIWIWKQQSYTWFWELQKMVAIKWLLRWPSPNVIVVEHWHGYPDVTFSMNMPTKCQERFFFPSLPLHNTHTSITGKITLSFRIVAGFPRDYKFTGAQDCFCSAGFWHIVYIE